MYIFGQAWRVSTSRRQHGGCSDRCRSFGKSPTLSYGPGPYGPGPYGPGPYMGRALMGWALIGRALMGRALMGWALMGQALMAPLGPLGQFYKLFPGPVIQSN